MRGRGRAWVSCYCTLVRFVHERAACWGEAQQHTQGQTSAAGMKCNTHMRCQAGTRECARPAEHAAGLGPQAGLLV